jgi:threonine dehydrogenase-like Zn-dependent dehydrogenase
MYGSPKKGGGMAQNVAMPLKNLVKLGPTFDIRHAGLVEPATVAYHAVRGFENMNVAVMGVGAIGTMMGQLLKHYNSRFIALDIDDRALKSAKNLGADLTVNLKDQKRSQKIKDFLKKDMLDAVVIAYLSKDNWDFAMDIVKKEGTIIEMAEPKKFEVDFKPVLFKSPTIRGSACYNYDEFKKAAELIEQGVIDAIKIITKTFPYDKAKEAFKFKANKFALKVIITN